MFVCYEESILSLIASISKYYGLSSDFQSDESLDELLNTKKPKHIIELLIDGMGANLIERKLEEDSFLKTNLFKKVSTVFPSSTTAATTSILNGKAPNQNAYLGWSQYFSDVDDEVVIFLNQGKYSKRQYEADFASKRIFNTTIIDRLNMANYQTKQLYPSYKEEACDDFDEMCKKLINYQNDYDFIYAYWDEYDDTMHKLGPNDLICDVMLKEFDQKLKALSEKLNDDTMLIVLADHGQIKIDKSYNLYDSKYEKYFIRKPSLETRVMAFHIKEELCDEFAKIFKEVFEDEFILLSKEQVLKTHLFGPYENHKDLKRYLGDFIAIAKSNSMLIYDETNTKKFLGNHGGILEDELLIPFVIYQK